MEIFIKEFFVATFPMIKEYIPGKMAHNMRVSSLKGLEQVKAIYLP